MSSHELDLVDPEVEELRATCARLERSLAKQKAKTADLVEAVHAAARDAAVIVGRPQVQKPPKDRRRRSGEVALLHLTDWQCGKVTPSFNMDVLEKRIGDFVSKVGRITGIQRADHPVRDCVVMLGGDMVEGVQIFPGQAWEVDATLFEQVFRCSKIITSTILSLSEMFENVSVYTESGNHGRLGKRGDYPGSDNMDTLTYALSEGASQSAATWHHSREFFNPVEIGAYRAMLAHGDEIKGFGGNVPAFGIIRKCNNWKAGAVDFNFHDVYLGHFHTPMTLTLADGGRVFVSGSPESDNAYAKEFCAAQGIPSQRLHYIDPAEGRITSEWTIWL